MARYRLKYCLKGPLNPKQPTNQPTFETVFQSISGRLPERGRKRRERIEENKNVQTTPTRTYCKRNRPLPYDHSNCRTPRHWKFTQHHRTTRPPPPPPPPQVGWLVGCFGFHGPLTQYFTLYRAVSQREGERRAKMIDERKHVQTTRIVVIRTLYL